MTLEIISYGSRIIIQNWRENDEKKSRQEKAKSRRDPRNQVSMQEKLLRFVEDHTLSTNVN